MRILYIEDEFIIEMNVRMRLKSDYPDIELVHAPSYAESVKKLEGPNSFDLIISDFNFPGKKGSGNPGGIDLFDYFRCFESTDLAAPPFYFCSNKTPDQIHTLFQERGLDVSKDLEGRIYEKGASVSDSIVKLVADFKNEQTAQKTTIRPLDVKTTKQTIPGTP
jgi:CheY-like chemotaxis protein